MVGLRSSFLKKNSQLWKLHSLTSLKPFQKLSCSSLDMDEVSKLYRLGRSVTCRSTHEDMSPPRSSKSPSQLTGLQCLCEFTISGLGISEIPNLSGSTELLKIVDVSFSRQLTSLERLSRFTCSEVYQFAGV